MPAHRRWWILAAVSLTQLLIILDSTIVNIALPRAQADLGLDDTARQWVVTAYALTFGAFLLLGGRICDHWGRRRGYLLGLAVFGVASAWGGLADSGAALLAARALQGAAAALMAPAALAFVTLSFPNGRERNRAFAVFGSLGGAGSAIGLLLGGILTEFLSWRWCLLINVPLVAVGLGLGLALLPENRAEGPARYDVAGALTVTLGLGSLVYGLTCVEQSPGAPRTWLFVGAGLVLTAGFVLIEHRSQAALLPLRILTERTRGGAFGMQALIGAGGVATMVYLAYHLQVVLRMGPLAAGAATLPFTVSLMAVVPFAVRLTDRIGPRRQMVVGPLVSAAGLLWLTRIGADGSYLVEVLPGLVGMGAGMGLSVVPLNNLALHRVDADDAGVASATVTATNQLGGSVGLAAATAVYVAVAAGPTSVVDGYRAVFAVVALMYLAASVVAWCCVRSGVAGAVGDQEGQVAVG